jgi:hypothetical protein
MRRDSPRSPPRARRDLLSYYEFLIQRQGESCRPCVSAMLHCQAFSALLSIPPPTLPFKRQSDGMVLFEAACHTLNAVAP